MSRSMICNGNVSPYRFVKQDVTADFKVLQATAGAGSHGDRAVGISQEGTHLPPWGSVDDGFAGVAGNQILVYNEGDECFILSGAAITVGDQLKSDSTGRGITASVTGDLAGAIALQSATAANQLIKVLVTLARVLP